MTSLGIGHFLVNAIFNRLAPRWHAYQVTAPNRLVNPFGETQSRSANCKIHRQPVVANSAIGPFV